MMTRAAHGLFALLGAALLFAVPTRAQDASAPPPERSIRLYNTHTREDVSVVYFAAGAFDAAALEKLNHVLRDHRSGESGQMDPPLFDYLFDVAARAGVPPYFDVISGFRSAASNEMLRKTGGGGVAQNSLHMKAQAIDVRLREVSIEQLRDVALELKRGGVGYYPQSKFVHLDTGRVRTWNGK